MLQLAVNKRDSTSKDSKAPWHYLPTNDICERDSPFTLIQVIINLGPGGNISPELPNHGSTEKKYRGHDLGVLNGSYSPAIWAM